MPLKKRSFASTRFARGCVLASFLHVHVTDMDGSLAPGLKAQGKASGLMAFRLFTWCWGRSFPQL